MNTVTNQETPSLPSGILKTTSRKLEALCLGSVSHKHTGHPEHPSPSTLLLKLLCCDKTEHFFTLVGLGFGWFWVIYSCIETEHRHKHTYEVLNEFVVGFMFTLLKAQFKCHPLSNFYFLFLHSFLPHLNLLPPHSFFHSFSPTLLLSIR